MSEIGARITAKVPHESTLLAGQQGNAGSQHPPTNQPERAPHPTWRGVLSAWSGVPVIFLSSNARRLFQRGPRQTQ
eukprot:6144179-Prymnesium_polylepis.1